jgi:hypothetical protein
MQAYMSADPSAEGRRWSCYPLGLLVGMAVGMGCWQRADRHCLNLDGDATCLERGIGSFCDACRVDADGCTYEQPSEECHFAGPAQASTSAGTTTDAGSSTEAPATSGTAPCSSDEECDGPDAPFCAPDGSCVGCDGVPAADAACAGWDETRPLCVDGECVQCSATNAGECDAMLQICDAEARSCTACVEHEQCESGACELARGRCFPPDVVVLEVDGDGGADYTNVAVAVADVEDEGMAILMIHELDGGGAYEGAPMIDGGKTIALLGAPGEEPVILGNLPGNPTLRVQGPGTTVYIHRLSLRDAPSGRGLVVREGAAWVDRSRIVGNAGGGVLAEAGASVTLRSSFVGGDADNVAVLEVIDATARVVYTTMVGGSGNASALRCNAGAAVEVRNSVLIARTNASEVFCSGTFDHDASEHALGGANTTVSTMSTTWFASYMEGDFHLSSVGAEVFADVARWDRGDPRTDIDGDARPGVDDAFDHAGADVP